LWLNAANGALDYTVRHQELPAQRDLDSYCF
jgi:hypothetical protein